MIGPNSSGRMAASIITAQPAWQFPMTQGLPSAWGCKAMTFSRNTASARAMSSIVWPGIGSGSEADEIARMPSLERHADLAVRFEAADPRAVPGARVDDDERSAGHVDLGPRRRDDAHQAVIHRPLELAAIDDELHSYSSTLGTVSFRCLR